MPLCALSVCCTLFSAIIDILPSCCIRNCLFKSSKTGVAISNIALKVTSTCIGSAYPCAGLGIRSFTHRSFAHLLISLKSNERLWKIRSERSRQMSNREQIAQVTQRKWAIVSDSLRSLWGNERCEWIAHFAHEKWANERFAQKILARKIFFYYVLPKV